MDIFNRPPSIAEDTLSFSIYQSASSIADLTALRTLIVAFVENDLLPSNHIWHRDTLVFDIIESPQNDQCNGSGMKLAGTMRVGDAVDDEWLVVWLLYQISNKWDVVIK